MNGGSTSATPSFAEALFSSRQLWATKLFSAFSGPYTSIDELGTADLVIGPHRWPSTNFWKITLPPKETDTQSPPASSLLVPAVEDATAGDMMTAISQPFVQLPTTSTNTAATADVKPANTPLSSDLQQMQQFPPTTSSSSLADAPAATSQTGETEAGTQGGYYVPLWATVPRSIATDATGQAISTDSSAYQKWTTMQQVLQVIHRKHNHTPTSVAAPAGASIRPDTTQGTVSLPSGTGAATTAANPSGSSQPSHYVYYPVIGGSTTGNPQLSSPGPTHQFGSSEQTPKKKPRPPRPLRPIIAFQLSDNLKDKKLILPEGIVDTSSGHSQIKVATYLPSSRRRPQQGVIINIQNASNGALTTALLACINLPPAQTKKYASRMKDNSFGEQAYQDYTVGWPLKVPVASTKVQPKSAPKKSLTLSELTKKAKPKAQPKSERPTGVVKDAKPKSEPVAGQDSTNVSPMTSQAASPAGSETGAKAKRVKRALKPYDPTLYCRSCGATQTPLWRRGPEGTKTLCNACGVRWMHGRL
ncbi:hypothetical protein BC832DRAFT_539152 [Gaertneriomyces semiglobifer]|nr:hypothetical protein BC832DRAFT_539152 [Gaertneriomyces semiglobifer]